MTAATFGWRITADNGTGVFRVSYRGIAGLYPAVAYRCAAGASLHLAGAADPARLVDATHEVKTFCPVLTAGHENSPYPAIDRLLAQKI